MPVADTAVRRRAEHPLLLLVVALCLAAAASARAQQAPPGPAPQPAPPAVELNAEAVQARMKQLDEAKDLDPAQKTALQDAYKQVLDQLAAAEQWRTKAAAFDAVAKAAPGLLAALKADLAKPPEEPKPQAPPDATPEQLDQQLAHAAADLDAAKKRLADLEAEPKRRNDRRLEMPKLIAAAKQRLDEITQQLAAKPEPGAATELDQAKRLLLQASAVALQQQLDACNKELASYDAQAELLTVQRDQAARQAARAEKLAAAWQDIVNERRRQDAEQQAREARHAAATATPAVRELAEENAALAEQRTGPQGTLARIESVSAQLDQVNQALAALKADFKSVREKVATVGLTHPIALLLRRKRAELPNVRQYRQSLHTSQQDISAAQLAILDLDDERAKLAKLEPLVAGILDATPQGMTPDQRKEIESAIREQLATRRTYLDALINDTNRYFTKLIDLDAAQRQLLDEAEAFTSYIDERILWVRSAPPVGLSTLARAGEALTWLAGPVGWAGALATLGSDLLADPLLFALLLLALAALLLLRRRLRRRLKSFAERIARASTDRFAYTLEAFLVTGLLAAPGPLVMGFVGWELAATMRAPEFSRAVGVGLQHAAGVYFVLHFFFVLCVPGGLAEAHFRWRRDVVQVIRRSLLWLMAVVLPMVFIEAAMEWQEDFAWRESLGRFAFMVGMLALAAFLQVVFRPSGKVMTAVTEKDQGGWLARLRHLWHGLAVLLPTALAVVAALGYYYTAQHLERRLQSSILLLVVVLLVRAGTIRWLFVVRRKLAVREALARRAAQAAEAERAAEAAPGPELPAAAAEQESLYTLSVRTRKLLHSVAQVALIVGLVLIWADVLPALKILQRVTLWSTTTTASQSVPGPGGQSLVQTVEATVPITLGSVLLAVVVIIVTVVAGRNVPGLLELAVLRRLPIEQGVRFAITAITSYVITAVGVVVALGVIGIGWSKVHWLVAAMTVGLGFGLQEIFANFISGLIILFERPMRVGDTVTVSDVTGTVTRIRIRATTITDWDRKELIVPNKEFITGRLVNWTLSDPILRLVFPVGIAYGSDTELAEKTLLQVARDTPGILEEPGPSIMFSGFGDSTLSFQLRAYISNMNSYQAVWHQVNMAIDRELRKAGIEIAFPQRDVHIRSIDVPLPDIAKPGKE